MGKTDAYKEPFSDEEAGLLLLQKMAGAPDVDPHECLEAIAEADAEEHEIELQAPDEAD